jgi:adenylate kinase
MIIEGNADYLVRLRSTGPCAQLNNHEGVKMRLLIMGAPGSGKGTQAPKIAERFGIPAISTGSIFRAVAASGTEFGDELAAMMNSGQLISDEITNRLLEERLAQPDAANGWLLDGYPRVIEQVHTLEEILERSNSKLDAAIYLEVPDQVLIDRLVKRGQIEGRADDNEETIKARMGVYHAKTEPALDFYAAQGVLLRVDGQGSLDEVAARVATALDALS